MVYYMGVASAPEFVMKPNITGEKNAHDATFVSCAPVDVPNNARLVALCAIPHEKAGPRDYGWHVADFLAYKTLLSPAIDAKSQVWFSMCNPEELVKEHPYNYTHVSKTDESKACITFDDALRGSPILIEPSAPRMMVRFIKAVCEQSSLAKKEGVPLVIVINGLTTLEQDIYFGDDGYRVVLTSEQIREAVDPKVAATLVTPSLTSSGWQINPYFNQKVPVSIIGEPLDFVARQCGGIFSRKTLDGFKEWNSPFLDIARVDPELVETETYPGPAKLSDEQRCARDALDMQTHSLLSARMMDGHERHGFDFNAKKDEWAKLIGPRKGKSLAHYAKQWSKLKTVGIQTGLGHGFLGNAFGGNVDSQIRHIHHLIRESSSSLPGYYSTTQGSQTKKELEIFLAKKTHEEIDVHVMFNTLEYRLTTIVLGDMILRQVGLRPTFNQRCRDWDEPRWNQAVNKKEEVFMANAIGGLSRDIGYVAITPGRFLNQLNHHQRPVIRLPRYIASSLVSRHNEENGGYQADLKNIKIFLQRLHAHQVKMILKNRNICALGKAWMESIDMPVARLLTECSTDMEESFLPLRVETSAEAPHIDENTRSASTEHSMICPLFLWSKKSPPPIGSLRKPTSTSAGDFDHESEPEVPSHVETQTLESFDSLSVRVESGSLTQDGDTEGDEDDYSAKQLWIPPHLRQV